MSMSAEPRPLRLVYSGDVLRKTIKKPLRLLDLYLENSAFPIRFSFKENVVEPHSSNKPFPLEKLSMLDRLEQRSVSTYEEGCQVEFFVSCTITKTPELNRMHHIQIFKDEKGYLCLLNDEEIQKVSYGKLTSFVSEIYDLLAKTFPEETNFQLEYGFLCLDGFTVETFYP